MVKHGRLFRLFCDLYAEPAIVNHLLGNHSERDNDQRGHNDRIVKMAESGNKIRDEIEGEQEIPNGKPKQNLC